MIIFLIIILVLALLLGIYITMTFHKFQFIKDIEKKRGRLISWCAAAVAILILIIIGMWYLMYSFVIAIHLAFIFFVCDLIWSIVKKSFKLKTKCYVAGIAAIIITAGYFSYAWVNAHNVVETDYNITSDKLIENESLKIVQITDSHIGTTFSGEKFGDYIDEISKQKPDVVVVTGDFVDGSTSYEDMVNACKSLGKAESEYGIYYIFGNHDLHNYGGNPYYSTEEFISELKKNNINILEDKAVLLGDKFYIAGRLDATAHDRETTEELLQNADKSKYIVLLDHQPLEYDEADKAGADLLLSGHTHGGQIFPLAYINKLVSSNEMVYGIKKTGSTTCIVSSGISEWGFAFRTGCKSEYVVINITGEKYSAE
ncbi:metallophosphoesterase [uncultured Clostridium sp.]|uniref:metallophosphoesterase n=1 Tax=uncultured Clostridium sp. TaxID=59620 RepID=UPI0025CE95E6|nr:metallophosphoesterase [uncultured Clostridium sp.]